MAAPSDHLALAAEFPRTSRADWQAQVSAVLARSGLLGDPEELLSHIAYDGVTVKPLYTAADAPFAGDASDEVRGLASPAGGWDVRARHDDVDVAGANAAILDDLDHGVTSMWVVARSASLDLGRVLDGVYLDLAPIVLDAGANSVPLAESLLALARARGVTELAGSLGGDPLGWAARTGTGADLTQVTALAHLARSHPGLSALTVDATIYHDAGGSGADEVAIATAVGVQYVRLLCDVGFSVDEAFAQIEFRFAVTDDQFSSIAKLRAARRVWARVAQLSGAAAGEQRQHAVTSAAMMTQRDAWVNMLRTTIACFAAATGGAHAITVAPFDSAIGRSNDFARRIARNTHAVLHDESSLGQVHDPAGGSWYVEALTEELARQTWTRFTALEARGGAANLTAVRQLLQATSSVRDKDIAHRRLPITGVSEFPNLDEQPVVRDPLADQSTGGLGAHRYSEAFESLRDRSDSASVRPKVFLATVGSAATPSGRVGFATNLFQAGGFEVVTTGDFATSGAAVACICAADSRYTETGATDVVHALRLAGASLIWLAGKPSLGEDGVDGYVHIGVDAIDVLTRSLEAAGV